MFVNVSFCMRVVLNFYIPICCHVEMRYPLSFIEYIPDCSDSSKSISGMLYLREYGFSRSSYKRSLERV